MFRVIILLLTVFAGLVKSQFIQEFSDPSTQSIISLNSAKGQQTFYQVDFSFQNNQNEFKIVSQLGASQLNINLKFPKEITLPNMLNECQIFTLLQGVSSYQNIDCQINQFSNSVQFNIDGSLFVQSANSIIFGQVNNPTNYDQSSDFELCINNNSNRIICQFRFGKQSFADPPIQMISAQVTPMSWLKISSGASYSFKFQLVGIYLSGHSIRIMFPQHFTSNSAYVRIQDNTCEKTISNLHMGRVIECLVLSQPISGLVQVDIINMINPNYSGYFMGFQIDLLKYSSNLIIETIQFDGQIQIQPGKIFASLDTTVDKSLISFGIPVYYLTIQTEHMLQNGYIQIQFDSQWQITSNTCTIVQIQEDDPPNYSCQLQGSNFIVSTFIQLQSYQKIIIELPIIQPSIQEGTSKIFRAHPMRQVAKLKAGQRGPIEILLFLNVQLPPTTSLTVGKIVITITPQVQQPVTQQNGILKCLFYERVMATSCVLNNSQSGKTIITVYTPSNYSFFQSEIPLIITTEGAIPGQQEGILVNTILQRYEFTVKTFNSDNPVASPLEIFYGEWVPDSFQLTNAIINPLALEQLEILVVQISFSCPVDLIMSGSSTNYAFILYFVSGVNIVIPPGQNSIQNFSCFLQGLTGVNVRCDLYQDRIQIYGFQSLVAGSSVTIIVSEIPLTVAPNTILNLTFSINQITPGMPTQYVQLYQINQQWVLFLQSQPNIYNMDYEVSVLQSSAVINSNPSFTISYTLNPIDTVLYYFPSSFKYILNSSTFTCGSSTCYYLPRAPSSNGFIILEKKAQPIANNPPNYNQLTVIPLGVIQAPPFQGNFPVNLYALFSQRVIKKAFFYIKFGSDLITTASFIITNPGQFIIKNTEHYFTVSFITKNYIPDQGSIQIFFHNGVTVQPNRYQLYCQLQSPQFLSLSYFPIQCSKNDSTNSLTITGFKIINSGVQLTITLRLLTDPVQSPINPTCDIYTLDQNGNPIDSITGVQNANNPITNNISSLQQFNIIDNYYRQNEYPPINYVGPFILQFQQSATIVAALNTIEVQFDSGFQIPNGISQNAPMYCQVNQVRAYCKVTSYTPQLTVQVYPQTNPAIVVNPITSNTLLISTEYVSPLDGIQHPSYADFYQVQVKLIDQFGNINLSTKYTKINPLKLVFFYVNSYCSSPGQYNLLLFHARFSQNVVKFSGGGRIYLVFPTFNQAGIALFSSNLGLSYDPLVDNLVACNFSQSQNTINAESGKQLKCRLKPQDYNSDSIRVEIINFDNISVDQEMYVFMTQIMNPSNLLVDITFQIEVQIIDQANSSILSNLNLDYFNVFLNMKSSTPNPDLTNPYTGNIFSSPSSVGSTNVAMISNKVYYTTAFSAQDIYYVQLPPNITPTLNFAGCDATQFLLCLSFPDANVLVYVTNSIPALTFSNINDSIISQLPISVPQTNTVFYSYVWQKTLYQGRVINQITANQWKSLIGSLSNVILNLMNSQTPLIKSIKTFIQLKFTTTHFIPAGGSIVIQFPIDFPAIYSHCESSFQNGSKLQSNYLTNSGSFGCSVQNNLQWVISNINQVQANSNIIITGRVDLPTTQITTQSLQITTLSTGFSANTLTSGFLIDQILNAPNTVLTMSQYSTMCMVQPEIDYVDIQQDILRSNFRGPLRMHLIINDNVLGNQGKFQIDLFRYSVNRKNVGGFPYNQNDKYVCGFESKINQGKRIGCLILSIQEVNTSNTQNSLRILMLPNEQLNKNERYELVLTTVNGINQEGIQFGLNPGTFRISLACDPQGLGAFKTIDQVYVQIYSNDFQQILVQSLINIPGEWNLILLKIQPQVTIKVTDQIILEFPVISLDSKNLFTENGGYSSLNDSDIILYDLVDASANLSAVNFSMTCRFFKGYRPLNQNLKFICSQLSSQITNADYIQIAISIQNPTIPANSQLSIPIQIYTYDIIQESKTHYRHEINAIPILNPGMNDVTGINGDFDLGNSQNTVCHNLVQTIHFRAQQSQQLQFTNQDVYLLRLNFPLYLNQPTSLVNCQYNNVAPTPFNSNCAILVNNGYILVFPSQSGSLNPTNLIWINNAFFTPYSKLESAAQRVVIGFAYYSSRRLTERIMYFDSFPQLLTQVSSSVSMSITSKGNIIPYQNINMDYIFTITAPYWSIVKKLAVVFPISSGFSFTYSNCKEAASSQVQIQRCDIDSTNKVIWITIQNSPNLPYFISDGTLNLSFQTLSLTMVNPQIAAATQIIPYNNFDLKFYSWYTAPAVTLNPRASDDYVCFSDNKQMAGGLTINADKAGVYPVVPNQFDYIHQQYFDEFVAFSRTQRIPIKVEVESPVNIPSTTWSASHKIIVHYNAGIQIPTPSTKNDLLVDALVCYINNMRVRCTNDSTNLQIIVEFIEAQALGSNIYIYVSAVDPNNLEKDGFFYIGNDGAYTIKYEIIINGGNSYFLYSDFFSAFYSTQNQPITPPHRGIEVGSITSSNNFKGAINVLEFTLSFDRSDIKGLVFEFLTVDQLKNQIYTTTTMHGLQTGSPFPCSKGIPVPNSSPDCNLNLSNPTTTGCQFPIKCFIEEGQITQFGKPIRVHAFGFAYTPKQPETFRLMVQNPTGTPAGLATPIDFLIVVKAYGGNQNYQYPYGNEFKGDYSFLGVISLVQNTPNTLPPAALIPSSAMWQINTLKFTTNQNIQSTSQSSLIQIVLADQTDQNICFFAPDQYVRDIFYLQVFPTPTTMIKYVYAYRLFQASESSTKIFNLGSLKCEHYRYNVVVNHFMSGSQDVLTYQLSDAQSISNAQLISSPNVKIQYFDFLTIQQNQPSQTLVKINISQLLTQFTPFYGNIISLEFQGTSQTNTIFQNGATSCTVMSGLSILNTPDHIGEQVQCAIETNTISGGIATRLKISNFDSIINYPYVNSLGSPLPQKDMGLKIRIMHTNSQYSPTNPINVIFAYYANSAAYLPSTSQGHLMFYTILSHTPDYSFPMLTTPNNQGFINQSLNIGTYYKITKITNNALGAQNNIQMTIDFQTNQDMYIGGDCTNVSYCMTCTCAQSCNAPLSANRQYWGYWYLFLFGLELDQTQTTCTIDVLGRIKKPNSPFDPEEVIACKIIYSTNGYPMIYIEFFEQFQEMGSILNYKNKPWEIYITLINQTFAPTNTQNYVWSRFHIYQQKCFNPTQSPSTVLLMENVFTYTTDYLQIGNTPSFSSLTLEQLYTTEYSFSLNNINLNIGVTYNTVLQLVFPTYVTNFIYATDPTKESQQISCLCSIPLGSPLTPQLCYRRIPINLFQATVLLYINVQQGNSITCYIPEIINPSAQNNLGVLIKVASPSIYSDYQGVGGYANVYQQTILVNILAQGTLKTGTFDIDPPTFYNSRQVNEQPLVRFAVDVNSQFFNWPYIYIRLPSIGPVPTLDFCNSPIFLQNRVYSVQSLLIVCQIGQNPNQITVFKGSPQLMMPAKPFTFINYELDIYVFDGTQGIMTHSFQQLFPSTNFNLAKTTLFQVTNIFLTLNVGLQTQICAATFLLNSFVIPKNKGRILISFSKTQVLLAKNACFVVVEQQSIPDLQCYYDGSNAVSHRLWIYRTVADLNTQNTIDVYFSVQNSATSNIDFTLIFYYSYTSDTTNQVSVQNLYTQTIQTADSSSTKLFLSYSYMKLYPFTPKIYTLPNTSERFFITFQNAIPLVQHMRVFTGKTVDVSQVSIKCTLRQYDSVKVMSYNTFLCSASIFDPTGSPAFEILFSKVQLQLLPNVKYEFIISTLNNNQIIGFQKDTVNTYREIWMFARQLNQNLLFYTRLLHYYDQGIQQIQLNSLYYTSGLQQQTTSLFLQFTLNPALPNGYPTSFISLTFPELTIAQAFPTANPGDTINCQLSTTFQQITSRMLSPRCIIVPSENGQLQIRIEQFNSVNANTQFSIAIDDMLLPAKYVLQWWNMNLLISVYLNDTTLYFLKVQQLLVVDGVTPSPTVNTIGPFNFNPPSNLVQGQISDYPVSVLNYPINSNYYDMNNFSGFKIRLQFFNGILAANKINNILIQQLQGATSQALNILWVNSNTNSIYISAPLINQSQQMNLVFKGLTNPYTYQQLAYGTNPYVQANFYQGNNMQRQTPLLSHQLAYTANLNLNPNIAFSVFQYSTPFLIQIQNPFNIDNQIIAALNQRAVCEIQFQINANSATLLQRKIKKIHLVLTSGFTNLENCWITTLTASTYLNSFQSCHITAANTVDILNVGDFNIAQGFSIFIQGHVISNNVQYIFELQTSDYLDDSSSPQTYTINQFDSVAKIYNELDLLQQKYIFGYYETAFTQLFFQDITPSLVFYIQFDSLLSLTYNTNYFEVSTATLVQVNQANGIMCSFSPVLTTSDLGLTIFCSCLYNSATNSYQIQSPVGGLNTNQQYALKIQEVVQNSQIQLQTVSNNGQELIFLNIRNAATNTLIKQQTLSLFFITRFNTINIKHATTTATFYDVIQINFSVTKDVVQNANEEVQLALHIESNYYLQDLGITQVYQSDNLGPFTSGQQFNCVLTPNLQIGIKPNCILQFGQYSNKFDQIRIIVSNIGNVLSGTTYTLNIGMILNPSTIQNTIDYTFLIIKKRISSFTTEQISQYVYKKRLLNHDYAKDPSLAVALQSSDFVLYNNINNQIQTNQLGMAISIFNTNLATVNQILLKYDNTLNGILNLQQVLSNLIIANCQVVYFAIINLVMLTPLQSIAKPASFNLGSSYQSQNYQSQWGFSLVWITDYSTAQTLYYNNNLQRNTLSVITDLALKNLNRISGVQNVGSQNLYEINFLTPFIPKQGIININLPSQLNFYKSQLNCIKLVKNFNVNPIYSTIRAFYDDSTNVIQIYAFGDIPSNTKVTIRLLLDNMNSGQAVNLLSIQILGNLKIASSLIVKSSAVVGVAIFNAPTISSSLQLLQITQTHLVTYFTQEFNALNLQISTSLTTLVNGNNYIELVFDQTNAQWQFAQGSNIINYMKYYQSWPIQVVQGSNTIAVNVLQLQTFPTYDIPQSTVFQILFTSVRASPDYQEGLKYPIRGVLRNVVLNIRNSGTNALVESSYIEYEPQVRKDNSFNLRVINCYSSQNSRGMKFQFNLNYKVSAGDEIRILFEMNDEINQIFVPYLGFNQAIQQIQCQETSSPQVISASSALLCNLQSNQIRIPFQQSVNPSTVISFWISNIINPSMQTTIGIYLQIMTYCRGNQGNLEQNDNRCILYHSKNYYTTQPLPPNGIQYGLQVSPMVPSTNTVFVMASHSFQIVFTNAVPANKDILITYPDNHIHTQPCNSAQGQCQILNNRSIIFNPTTPINAGQTYSFTLNNVQNGISLSSLSQDNYIYIEIYDGQTSLISQAYKIIFNPYTPYTQGISASIYNTQTQNTYLKGNFQNIAQLLVSNIWHDQYITSFVIWKPAVIQGFIDQSYCNATLLIPNPNPFPLILQCSISALGDAIYISSNGVTYQSTFSSLVLSVYFKVIIDSNFPPQGVPAGFTDNLIVYGCVQQCNTINPSRFYQTMATTQLYVSNDRVPYYAGISWNQYAFHQAKSIFQGEARFYGVIQQSSPNQNINKIILQIEDSFLYPPIMFIQGCLIYNNQVTIQIDKCQLKQVQGKSQIEIVLSSGYFLSLQPNFFYIQTQAQQFQAPEYPGQHYQIKVDLYQANTNNPIEEVQVFFSRVIGVQFDRNSMQFLNGLDAKIPNLNELIFVTSNVPIPQGYLRQDSDVYSEIHVLFEWIPSGVQKGSGYAADIGTGLQDGQQLDCISKAGLQFTQGKGIKCFLKIAQTSDSTSRIRILNYEAINPNTKIDLIFIGIQSLDINVSGLIKVAVELVFNYLDPVVSILNSGLRSNTYDQAINRSYLYMPSPLMPDLTSSLQVTTNTNPTTVTQTGSTTTLGYSSFSFTFTLGSQNLKTTDYVAFIFPSGFIPQHITDFSSVTSPQGSNVYVFSLGSTIFVQPFTQQNMNSVVTITINNLINPFFTIQLGVLQISAFTYINRKQDTSYVFNLQNYHNDYNTLISNTNLQYNSTVARAKNVQYTIQFQLNQFLPHFGIIQVIFPTITFKSLYNLDGFSCYLDGYQDQSICQVGGSNKANIYIQNLLLTPNSVYTIVLNNISNPSIDISQVSQAQYFSLAIYYNSQYLNVNQPYSMVSIGYPLITQIYVRPIYFVVQVDYPIYQIESLYKFQILCNFDISENSRIVIILGQSYSYYPQQSGTSTKIECSSPYILSETCQVQYSLFEGSYTLEIQTVFVPLLQTFQISAILMNPSYDPSPVFYQVKIYEQGQIYSYYASSTINSNQRLQQTIQFYPIQSSSSSVDAQIFSSSFILSQNIPNQPNQQAYYVFKLCQNNNNLKKIFGLSQNQVIMTLKFPDNFANMNSYQSSIEYFIDYYQPDQKIYSVLMIEQLISTMKLTRVSQINNLQSQFYSKNTIQFILNISQQIDPNILNSWNYLIVKNIVNPQKYIPQNFELKVFDSFSNFQIMYLNVAKQLQYQIVNETPSLIMISSIQPQSFLFNQITDYIFTIEYSDNLLQIIHTNQYYLLIVTLPLQQKIKYLQNIQCFIQGHQNQIKANSDQCYIFTSIDSTNISIALKLTFQLISSSSFQLVIRNLINPTYNFPSIQVNEFSVKIMDYSSSQIICSDINYRILNPKYYSHTIYFQNPYSLTIQVGGPAVLYRGLKYEYKIMLQAPAYNLVIIPVVLNYLTLTPIKSSQIQITPSQITFENFQNQLTQSFFLSFAFDYPIASQSQYFILRFQQTQDSQLDNFINVPDLNIQLSNDQAIKPVIALNLDNLDINTQGYPFFISVSISSLPAQPTYLSLVSDQNDKFYSADFINNLVISNSKILITDSTEYQFQVCYQGKNIPQPIPLKIQILSQNQNIQNLYKFYPSNKFYLVFSYSPYYSNSIARIQIMSFTPDYNYTQLVGKPIAYQNVSNYSPHIMKVVQDSVSQTTANFIIFIDQLCKISYIVTLGQEQVEPNTQNFLSNYYQFAVNIGSVFTNQFNLQLIENMQQILLVNLQAQQNYIIYFMAQNAMGYSSIYKQYFNTSDISQPCSLYLTFQDIVNNQTLIMGLSSILRISPNNIMILSSFNVRNNNSPSYGYLHTKQALVIPDILGSYDPKTLLYSSQNQILKQLDRFIPSFDKASILSIQEMPIQIPEFTSLPILISLNIYDATFSINTQVQSIVFAVFVPEIQINIQPYQIANCINANNQLVEKVNCIKVISETSGYSSVFIDFLNEQTTYYGYFTAAALTPYNSPLHLSKQVKMVSFTTNANSNLNQCGFYKQLKQSNPQLAQTLQKYTDDDYVYC